MKHLAFEQRYTISAMLSQGFNGLIRQCFPKKAYFENITNQDIANVQFKLNNKPRKKLDFITPNEYFLANFTNNKVAFES